MYENVQIRGIVQSAPEVNIIDEVGHAKTTGVYIAWLKDAALYVGCSQDLRKRSRKRDAGHQGRFRAFRECDRIETYPCETIAQARQLEIELVGIYNPPYNVRLHRLSLRSIERLCSEHGKLFGVQP